MTAPYNTIGKYLPDYFQKYVPQAFDDSLTYYEQMTAVISYLNQIIDNFNTLSDSVGHDMTDLTELVDLLNNSVETFKLNLENEVLPTNLIAILDDWLLSGKLATILTTELLDLKANQADLDTLEATVSGMSTTLTDGLADINTELDAGLGTLGTTVNTKLAHLVIPATSTFSAAEKADLLLAVPLLNHTASIQAYVDAQKAAGNVNLYFPKGHYRFAGVNLYDDAWNIQGVPSIGASNHETVFHIINNLNAVGFTSTARYLAMSDFDVYNTGLMSDGKNVTFYKNSLANGQFLTAKNIYASNLSGKLFDTFELIASTFEQIKTDYCAISINAQLAGWDQSTTVTLRKCYFSYGTTAIDMPRVRQSRMVDCIFEYNTLAGDITEGIWELETCYFENNTAGFLATDAALTSVYCFYNTGADYPLNEQPTLDRYHYGEATINKNGATFTRFEKHYEISGNLTENNGDTEVWNRLGTWYPAGGGSRLEVTFLGATGFGQVEAGDGLNGNTGKTTLLATYTGNSNPNLPAVTAYAYHEGSAKPVKILKIAATDQYKTAFDIYVKMGGYASKVSFSLETTTGHFRKLIVNGVGDPGAASSTIVDVPFEFQVQTGTGSFMVAPDGSLRLVAPTEAGGTAPATIDQYMWLKIGATYYKLPLYL